MDYTSVDDATKRQMVTDNINNLERQHYQVEIDLISNQDNKAAVEDLRNRRAVYERGIAHLRKELESMPEPPAQPTEGEGHHAS